VQSALEAQRILRWLVIVRWIALADLVLLIVLLVASFADNEELVQILGLLTESFSWHSSPSWALGRSRTSGVGGFSSAL